MEGPRFVPDEERLRAASEKPTEIPDADVKDDVEAPFELLDEDVVLEEPLSTAALAESFSRLEGGKEIIEAMKGGDMAALDDEEFEELNQNVFYLNRSHGPSLDKPLTEVAADLKEMIRRLNEERIRRERVKADGELRSLVLAAVEEAKGLDRAQLEATVAEGEKSLEPGAADDDEDDVQGFRGLILAQKRRQQTRQRLAVLKKLLESK